LFLDRVYIYLDGEPSKEIMVRMKLKAVSDSLAQSALASKAHLEQLSGEFHNELLNQLLREKVSESNAKIREYIVAQALYSAVPNEVDELLKEVEEEDWQEDPLGIAKTWEESSSAEAAVNMKATDDKEQNKKGKKGKKGRKRK
jgi:His-Xaa-Ser system protein HxsD